MVDIVVLGSIGIDSIKTPFGKVDHIIGGSAVYASLGASFFAKVGIISVKGTDLPESDLSFLTERGISLAGIQSEGKNFRWSGEYKYDMNEAKTLSTELNSLGSFSPVVPDSFKDTKFLFLGNMDPDVQIDVIKKMNRPELIVIDSMNFWIQSKKDRLLDAIKMSDVLILNEGEARQLFETPNLARGAKMALSLGIKAIIIKKGEHGSLLFTPDMHFVCPGYQLENVVDPTGCGDTFGGSFLGFYAKSRDYKKSIVYASVIASFNAEGFGCENLKKICLPDIEERFKEIKKVTEF